MATDVFLLTNDSELIHFTKANDSQLDVCERLVLDSKGRLINVVSPSDFLEVVEELQQKYKIRV